ncbi:HNH endonuclease [Spirosoma migulaei]
MSLIDLFPARHDGLCACGCNEQLGQRKKRWATATCQEKAVTLFFIVKGDTKAIRNAVYRRDGGICACCKKKTDAWQADHILPVCKGGGYCDLDNLQTLCSDCHKKKDHYTLSHHKAYSSQAA